MAVKVCLIAVLSLFVTSITGPTLAPSCFRNGKFYPVGTHYQPSACEHCYCTRPQEQCVFTDCFVTQCVDAVRKPGECCPLCPNGPNCWAGKTKIPAGKDVKIDAYTTCRCQQLGSGVHAGQALCTMI